MKKKKKKKKREFCAPAFVLVMTSMMFGYYIFMLESVCLSVVCKYIHPYLDFLR